MLPVKSWRIFYADGSMFDSSQGAWADAPPFGVQVVVWYHDPPYKTLEANAEDDSIYVYRGEDAYKDVKMGLWMDADGYYRIQDLALQSTAPEV